MAGSAILSVSIGLNAITSHGTCTAVFVAVAAIVAWCLTSIPTLSKLSWLAAAGAASILVSSKFSCDMSLLYLMVTMTTDMSR